MLFAGGDLEAVPLYVRAGSVAIAFVVYLLFRRSMLAGVLAGEAVVILGAYYTLAN